MTRSTQRKSDILRFLRQAQSEDGRYCLTSEVAAAVGMRTETARNYLAALVASGTVKELAGFSRRRGQPALWRAAESK